MLGIDEGCRLRVGKVLFQHASRTPSAQDFIDYYEGHWFPNFGKPQILRLDPAGCFRSKSLDAYLAERQIEVQRIPAEAHWQISLAERSVQTIKAMMTALVSEQPQMRTSEAFARATWACNNRDQYLGFSPLQHAFGRAPDELGHLGESKLQDIPILTENGVSAEFGMNVKAMITAEKAFLEEQSKERLRRASLSGARTMKHFCPGDLVYVWRRMTPKGDSGGRHFKGRSSARAHQKNLSSADFLEECGVVFPEEESVFWTSERPAVSLSVELPKWGTRQGKEWSRALGCFFVKQLRKQAVEISERHLTPEELAGFRHAKSKEVRNFIVSRAFQALPKHLKPSRSQILKMRWILTWKLDDKPGEGEPLKRDASGNPLKPKARAVVLGYMDPEYEFRPTSSPTMTRTTRQLFLQTCSNLGFDIEKGDISGAFLQGDNFGEERPMVCEPLPEICEALNVPHQTPMLLTKAAYGLVEAPTQWFLSISRFLESIGAIRQLSDPCCWGFFAENGAPIGYVCGHVDDFMFGGCSQDPAWCEIKRKIQERFKWGQWEQKRFLQCGVLIEQVEGGFELSQPEYLDAVSEIHIGKSRWNEPSAPVLPHELYQLRSVLGALSWHANQVAPQWSAAVGMLLSKSNHGTVQEIIDTNKLLRKAKLGQHQKLRIHKCQDHKPLIAAWADAADSHRPDGGSTRGIFIGWTSHQLLQGDLVPISPVLWQSAKIQRTCRSSGAAETHAAIDAEDELFAVRFQVQEFLGKPFSIWQCNDAVMQVDGVLVSDSKNLYDRLSQTVLTLKGAEKRTDIESLCLKFEGEHVSYGSPNSLGEWG